LVLPPQAGQSAGLPNWAQAPTGNPFAGFTAPKENLTARALRMKGVPEADIAAAAADPELMKQLITQHFGPGSAGASAASDALWSGRAPAAPVVLPPRDGPTAPAQPQGHGKSDLLPAGAPIWARPPTGNPFAAYPGGVRGAPGLTDQNLTAHALRMKGVPDADIATAIGNPERMKQLIYQTFGAGSANAPATPDDLWSGRTPAEPLVLAPQQHGKGDRLPAGLPSWAFAPGGNPFATAPGSVRGVPARHFGDESGQDTSVNQPSDLRLPNRPPNPQQVLRILRLLTRRRFP
jgi:hypothetical protein